MILSVIGCKSRQENQTVAAKQESVATETPPDTLQPVVKFDFNAMKADTLTAFKGGDKEVYMKSVTDGPTKIMYCTMPAGSSVGFHRHETNMEIIRVEKGTAKIVLDGEEQIYEEGTVHYCPMGHGHSIHNAGEDDLVIYNVISIQ